MTERTLEEIEKDIQSTLAGEEQDDPEEQDQPEGVDDEEVSDEKEQEDEEGPEVTEEEGEQTDAEKAMALGWKPFQEYVDEGGDPDMYRGATAFLHFYDERKQGKEKLRGKNEQLEGLKDELVEFGQVLVDLKKNSDAQIKKAREEERAKLTRELERKKEDLDPEGYHDVKTKLDELGDESEEEVAPHEEHEVIQNFRSAEGNEVFDRASPDFDPEINGWLETRVNQRLMAAAQNNAQVTERTLEKVIQEEYQRTKRAFPEVFDEEVKPKRKGQRRRAPQTADTGPSKGTKPSRKLDETSQAVYDSMVKNGRQAAADEFKSKMLEA